ncbi:hypothetical protein [Streptacidiphilus rugosus]|uniref:hypothetical protein n=1 Tax=Streptacidiphilus rugosus TaxID=405783 RepID=UPI00068D9D2D|nr:hypothetical protein [Streptacidiphilus rugosus]
MTAIYLSEETLPDAHPVHEDWVERALAQLAGTECRGALIGRPLTRGPGVLITLRASGSYELLQQVAGSAPGRPAHYATVLVFEGPRDAARAAAEERASTARLTPATSAVPGVVATLRARRADNGVLVVLLAESVEALDEASRAALSTPLLPGEDPSLLAGPDRIDLYRLVHVDLP